MMRKEYEVVVGNLGTVYRGTSKAQAIADFRDYARRSAKSNGRVAGEDVYLMCDGEILMEHNGYRETGDYDYDDREDNPSGGSDCEIYDSGIPSLHFILHTDARGRHRRLDLYSNGYTAGGDINITPKQAASIKKRRRLHLSDLTPAARATAEKYMGKGRTANPRKKAGGGLDCTLSITSSPMFYTPNIFRGVMNDAQFKPVPKWCKSMLDAMNIPPAVAKELISGKRSYKINDERETVEIPVTQAELDEAVAMSKRR